MGSRRKQETERVGHDLGDTVPFPTPAPPSIRSMVPTVDTVRYSCLVTPWWPNQNPVPAGGSCGDWKTSIARVSCSPCPPASGQCSQSTCLRRCVAGPPGQVASPALSLSLPLGAQCPLDMPHSLTSFSLETQSVHSVPFPPDHIQ